MSDLLREGWTQRIKYALTSNGAPLDLSTALDVTLTGASGRALIPVVFSGASGVEDAPSGLVFFDPDAGELLASKSPYLVRWQITDADGGISFYPRDAPLCWVVKKP